MVELLLAPVRLWVSIAFSLAAIRPILTPEIIPAIRPDDLLSFLGGCALIAVPVSLAALPLLAVMRWVELDRPPYLGPGFGLVMAYGPAGILIFGLWDLGLVAVYEVAALVATAVFILLGGLQRRILGLAWG